MRFILYEYIAIFFKILDLYLITLYSIINFACNVYYFYELTLQKELKMS